MSNDIQNAISFLLSKEGNLLDRIEVYSVLVSYLYNIELRKNQKLAIKYMLEGNIVDVPTGEGKTIIIAIVASEHLIFNRTIHVSTVNNFLAKRDFQYASKLFNFLNLDISKVLYKQSSDFIFDYLTDREIEFDVAILDEIDYTLIECANTDYSISIGNYFSTISEEERLYLDRLYAKASFLIGKKVSNVKLLDRLVNDFVYNEDKKILQLTDSGLSKLTDFSNKELSDLKDMLLILKCYKKDVDYIIRDNQAFLVNTYNGVADNSKLGRGLSKYIEYIEKLPIYNDSGIERTMSFPVFFKKYRTLIGCSGSVYDYKNEIYSIFKIPVKRIKSNKQITNLGYYFYNTIEEKHASILNFILTNRNLTSFLVICNTDEESFSLYNLLKSSLVRYNISLLNNNSFSDISEVEINSGKENSITISTMMLGRGVDIKTNSELTIIVAKHFKNLAMEHQVIGRTARNGNKGNVVYILNKIENNSIVVDSKSNYYKNINIISQEEAVYRKNRFYIEYFLDIFNMYMKNTITKIFESRYDFNNSVYKKIITTLIDLELVSMINEIRQDYYNNILDLNIFNSILSDLYKQETEVVNKIVSSIDLDLKEVTFYTIDKSTGGFKNTFKLV